MKLTSNDIRMKVLSSLEKVFPTDPFPSTEETNEFTVFTINGVAFKLRYAIKNHP